LIIRTLIDKYLKRNAKTIDSDNTILEMNGIVLLRSNDKDFDFKSTVIEEVRQYCSENGVDKIDKVVIMSVYDADLHNTQKRYIFDQRTISKSESKIIVVKEDEKVIAQVFFAEYVEIQGDN
jgi:protein-arginine kinase